MSSLFNKPFRLLHDSDKNKPPLNLSVDEDIQKANAEGYGVFARINSGNGYKDSDISKVNAWWVDIDFKDVEKPLFDDIFDLLPLIPSVVVETKNGYHIYYKSKDATTLNFKKIQKTLVRMVPYADDKVVNLARIMRVPNYLHAKDINNKFMVNVILSVDVSYYEKQLLDFYVENDTEEYLPVKKYTEKTENDIYDRIRYFDSRIILQQLSGTSAVGFKNYRFKRMGSHYNIIVDGKDSGCFINEKGNIIASDGYSGGAVEWLTWYGHSRVDAMKLIKGAMQWD